MKNYINEGIEPEVREVDNYVISVAFDKNWLCFEAQIIDRDTTEMYFESGNSKELAFTNSMRLIKLLRVKVKSIIKLEVGIPYAFFGR